MSFGFPHAVVLLCTKRLWHPARKQNPRPRETVALLSDNITSKFTDEKASHFLILSHAETVAAAGWKQKLVSQYAHIQK